MFWNKKKNKKKSNKKHIEFSKKVLVSVMITYFIGLFFGIYVINKMTIMGLSADLGTAIGALFTFIGGPVSIAIGFYSYKAKAENVEKIKNKIQYNESIGDASTD